MCSIHAETASATTWRHWERSKTCNICVRVVFYYISMFFLQLFLLSTRFHQELHQSYIEAAIFTKKWLSVIVDFGFFVSELRISEQQQHCRVGRQLSIAAIFFSKFFDFDFFRDPSCDRKITIFRKVFWGKNGTSWNKRL